MSLMWPLRRFIDIMKFQQEEEDLRRQREAWPRIKMEGDTPRRRDGEDAEASRRMVCRVCGDQGPHDYCVTCLAFTMEPAP